MRFYNQFTAILFTLLCFCSSNIICQEAFGSREELNQYIFQNSDLENITDGYLLDFNHDITPDIQDSFFSGIKNSVQIDQILSYLKLMEDSDVSGEFEMDSVLFPVMDMFYANNKISPITIPLFICDIAFDHLNDDTYKQFSNWSSTNPFPQLDESQLEQKHEVMMGLFVDTLTNTNIRFYWNDETYFTNRNRIINKVNLVINGDSIRLEKNIIYDLRDYFSGTLSSLKISVEFSDGIVESKTNKFQLSNVRAKSNCDNFHPFTSQERPWGSLGGLCELGYISAVPSLFEGLALPGVAFSVLWGCGAPQVLDKPYIIVSGWGPYTDDSFINWYNDWPTSIIDIYPSYNQEGFIENLRDAGYDVIIAKFYPPNLSILDNSGLLEELIKMVNEEKFSNGSYEENIVAGYSAGSQCIRLTLQRMEKEHLEGTNEHHHSKLFVSYEGEHGGSNVPLALQHMVEHLESTKNIINTGLLEWKKIYGLHYILNAPLSKELLKYFHTETGTSSGPGQGSHPKRAAYLQYHNWFNHPKNTHNPGYPSFTRNISISNGMSQSRINFPVHDHPPFAATEGKRIFEHDRSQRRWEAFFLGNSAATPWVFKYEEKSWGQWDIVEEARVHQPLILDNAPGGTFFLANDDDDSEPNITYQVLRRMEKRATNLFNEHADYVAFDELHCFTPTIFTHDIRNFDPSTTGGRLDYDMKAEGLMYQSISDLNSQPSQPSSHYGYPHLAHPQDHYTNYTPFDAVFAWDEVNTVHVGSGEAKFDATGHEDNRGKWEQIYSPVRGVIKNFIVAETDFYNAFIQNRSYGWNAKSGYIYKADIVARNEIYAGDSVTHRTNFKPAEVQQNADISFTACKSVNLKSGFHAQSGSEFHAQVNDEVCGCVISKSAWNSSGTNEYRSQEETDFLSFEEKSVNSMDIRLYPNPGRDKVNLQINDENIHNFEYSVFDLQGKRVMTESVNGTSTTLLLDKGVYILKIKTNDEWHTRKLIMY